MLKALKQTITRKDSIPDIEEPKVPKGILMNSTRRRILQYLSRYPCIYQNGIAAEMGLSLNNGRWHLNKLVDNGYLSTSKIVKKRVFYPTGLIEPEDIDIFTLVNNKKTIRIFPIVAGTPGITQKEISVLTDINIQTLTTNLKQFESQELLTSVRDGSHKRYYPTDTFITREKKSHKRFKEFRQIMLKILVRDGVNPIIIRTTDRNIHIQITAGKAKSNLILYLNPYNRFLSMVKPAQG